MTKDEILAMKPGRELDALVAEKVMGLSDENLFLIAQAKGPYTFDEDGFTVEWSPSTDISAAWEVVGKFKCYELSGITFHTCKLWKTISQVSFEYQGKTAPEAICKAALLSTLEG